MIEKDAINLVRSELHNYRVKKIKETPMVFLFMCESPNPEAIPSKIAIAVNKKTSKIGSSIKSYEDAIDSAM